MKLKLFSSNTMFIDFILCYVMCLHVYMTETCQRSTHTDFYYTKDSLTALRDVCQNITYFNHPVSSRLNKYTLPSRKHNSSYVKSSNHDTIT